MTLDQAVAAELLDVARRVAKCAADRILACATPLEVAVKTRGADLVTAADRAAEGAVAELLERIRPADGLLAEEGARRPPSSQFRWIVDPLDGTTNFAYGRAHWAVSIACEIRAARTWSPAVGVVHDALRGETFAAARGHGASVNGAALRCADRTPLANALIATEFSRCPRRRGRQVRALSAVAPRVGDLRCSGSSALDLCWVAAGRLDGFFEDDLDLWDWRAGALIVEEAGGAVSPLGRGILAAGRGLHGPLRRLVEAARRGRGAP